MATKRQPSEIFTLLFRWGSRTETQAECEQATLRFLKGLRKIDPVFQKWRYEVRDKVQAVPLTAAAMHALHERFAFRDDILRRRVPEDGFNLCLHTTGPDDEYCSVELNIGSYSHPSVENRCWFEPPHLGASAKRVWKGDKIHELCRWIIHCWSPESGEVFSSETLDTVENCNAFSPRPGWIMYTTRTEVAGLSFPKPTEVEQIAGHGTLITVVPEIFDSANNLHVTQLRRVYEAITPPKRTHQPRKATRSKKQSPR